MAFCGCNQALQLNCRRKCTIFPLERQFSGALYAAGNSAGFPFFQFEASSGQEKFAFCRANLFNTLQVVIHSIMISNERPSPYRRWSSFPPKPHVVEDTLKSGVVQIERKTFVFTLKE